MTCETASPVQEQTAALDPIPPLAATPEQRRWIEEHTLSTPGTNGQSRASEIRLKRGYPVTLEQVQALSKNYLDPSKMVWLVVGDAKTQLPRMKELGFGEPVLIAK